MGMKINFENLEGDDQEFIANFGPLVQELERAKDGREITLHWMIETDDALGTRPKGERRVVLSLPMLRMARDDGVSCSDKAATATFTKEQANNQENVMQLVGELLGMREGRPLG